MMPTSIFIIMPVKNAASTVTDAIESFLAQDWPHKHLVIVDGLSTDGTGAIVDRYAQRPEITLLRQQDASATEALNRGAALADGDVIGLLMGDDWLEPGALAHVAQTFEAEPSLDIVSGAVRFVDETKLTPDGQPTVTAVAASDIGLSLQSILGVPYPAAFFFKTSLWKALGGFSTSYRYGGDRDFLMRCLLSRRHAARLAIPVYAYRKHAASDTLVDNAPVVMAFLADHLAMARIWIRDFAPTADEVQEITTWRRTQVIELAARYMRAGPRNRAIGLVLNEASRDPAVLGVALGYARRYVRAKVQATAYRSQHVN